MRIFLLNVALLISGILFGQREKLDSIQAALPTLTTDSMRLANYNAQYSQYRLLKQNDSALIVAYQMEAEALKSGVPEFFVWSQELVSIGHYITGNQDTMAVIMIDAISKVPKDDTIAMKRANLSAGQRLYWINEYAQSVEYYFEAIKYGEMLGKSGNLYKTLASSYSQMNDELLATKYNLISIDRAKEEKDTLLLKSALLSQGYYYLMLIKHADSYKYSMEALDLIKNQMGEDSSSSLGVVYGNLADVYIYYYHSAIDSVRVINPAFNQFKTDKSYEQAVIDTAKYYIDRSYEIAKKFERPTGLFYVHYGYGDLNYYQGKIAASEKDFMKCYNISLEQGGSMVFDRKKVAEQLYKVHKKLGNNTKALSFYEEFVVLKDSLFDAENQKDIGKAEANFEAAKKEAQKDKLAAQEKAEREKAEAVKAAEIKAQESRSTTIIYAVSLVLILITVFAFIIFQRLRIASRQKLLIEKQKVVIEKNRNQMLESIEYSKNIQQRIFLTLDEMKVLLPGSFIFFKPKDVVSGDFYWAHKKNNKTFFAVADCTGHGVPGAFMTLISLNMIESIVQYDITSTTQLLEKLHHQLIQRLSSRGEYKSKHGLDIAVCAFNHDTNELEFSGLHSSLYLLDRYHTLKEIKGDKLFLGSSSNFNVTSHKIKILPGDSVYMSTDGFPDQKGGNVGKKFYYSRFRDTIIEADKLPLDQRSDHLGNTLTEWKKDKEQIDDICIMGVTFD
ncbi:MAG: serine phosphatase RsbU (regulator of sigma subunit)/tetratricopeptide (TPR) repeat protein [Parvicella sp.]|jgi:serine phosphatase RsbU (regulator of sigma subunit)/tetratricopeptide (TPR) repeat protein